MAPPQRVKGRAWRGKAWGSTQGNQGTERTATTHTQGGGDDDDSGGRGTDGRCRDGGGFLAGGFDGLGTCT
jgi:hypothetical protein